MISEDTSICLGAGCSVSWENKGRRAHMAGEVTRKRRSSVTAMDPPVYHPPRGRPPIIVSAASQRSRRNSSVATRPASNSGAVNNEVVDECAPTEVGEFVSNLAHENGPGPLEVDGSVIVGDDPTGLVLEAPGGRPKRWWERLFSTRGAYRSRSVGVRIA
jgi:hypothetical protein